MAVRGTLSALAQTDQGVVTEIDISDQRFWLNGIHFGEAVAVSEFNSSSNLTTDADSDPIILRNVKRTNTDQVEVGGQNRSLPIPEDFCQFHVHLESDTPITITQAGFYAYNGIDDNVPLSGIDFYAIEGGNSIIWIAANGYSQALPLSTYPASRTHDWFIGVSASPTSTGTKQGKIKFVYTYS